MSEPLFDVGPLCGTCGGTGQVWDQSVGARRPCPTCKPGGLRARRTDPPTSHKASAAVEVREGPPAALRRGTQKHRILQVYRASHEPLTDAQAWTAAGLNARAGAWHRCSDLLAVGYIEQVGTTVDRETGKEVRRCRITDAGIAALDTLEEVTL